MAITPHGARAHTGAKRRVPVPNPRPLGQRGAVCRRTRLGRPLSGSGQRGRAESPRNIDKLTEEIRDATTLLGWPCPNVGRDDITTRANPTIRRKVLHEFKAPHKLKGLLPNYQAANIPKTDITSKPHGHMPELDELLAKQPPAPQWDPSAILYTDGSVHKHPYHRVGAGVYDARDRTTYKINPCGRGPTNTINRAELTAIHYTIEHLGRHENITVATDSLCSLQMIHKILHRPRLLLHAKHGQLLRSIATMITDRAVLGIHTNLIKVKAHTGIVGNEIADKAANEASRVVNRTFSDSWGRPIRKHALASPAATGRARKHTTALHGRPHRSPQTHSKSKPLSRWSSDRYILWPMGGHCTNHELESSLLPQHVS
eukprot:jgi/Chrzof1/3149/Cz12g13190.t1